MADFRWGIFGTGAISGKFVAGLAAAQEAKATLIVSRSREKAERFAAAYDIADVKVGYREAAAQGGVDAVYIASPPAEHVNHALACIEAGLPVLIEKPFAVTAADARRIAEAARANSVFAMEAMWTRFLPAAQRLRDMVEARAIGDVRMVSGSFGTSQTPEVTNSIFREGLGGGALTHLGAYPLSLAQWLFGRPQVVQSIGTFGETGVIEDAAFQLRYRGDVLASFIVSIRTWAPDDFQVLGTDGMIGFRGSIVRPHGLNIVSEAPLRFREPTYSRRERLMQNGFVHRIAQLLDRSSRGHGRRLDFRYAGNGYHYEADEVRRCIERGMVESSVMGLDESVAIAATADEIRRAIETAAKTGKDAG